MKSIENMFNISSEILKTASQVENSLGLVFNEIKDTALYNQA